ncbi:MAG: hypothetical protein V7752_12365 [Halopseudomonas sp.]
MFIILKQAAYFARQHAQPLLIIALLLSVPSWIIDYALPNPAPSEEGEMGAHGLGVGLLLTALAVIQFAAAMIYIHQQVLERPVSAIQAITMGASRFVPLLLINIMMALAIGLGMLLLILPGLYLAYKLMFGEFYLLFHGQSAVKALRSSYRDNTDLADKFVPPLLVWGVLIASASIVQQLLLEGESSDLLINIAFEAASIALTLWGWAIMYRLYQVYIEPIANDADSTVAVVEQQPEEPELDSSSQDQSPEFPSDSDSSSDSSSNTEPEPPKQD